MKHALSLAVSLFLVAAACGKKDKEGASTDKPTTTEGTPKPADPGSDKPAADPPKPAAGGRAIPNANGLTVDAPAKWKDNGIGGAAGMHLDADAGGFQIRELEAEEAGMTLADWKTQTEEMLFQKWISADETADGFTALYVIDKVELKGEEMVKAGSLFAFHVKRKVGDKTYYCYGSAAAEADAKEALDLCTKFKAS